MEKNKFVDVVGLRLHSNQDILYFSANKFHLRPGQYVIANTPNDIELGIVAVANRRMELDKVHIPFEKEHLYPVVRFAAIEDIKQAEEVREKEKKAFAVCVEKIKSHRLKMNLTNAEMSFTGSKIVFFFTAESRVDFRDLVKDLASTLKSRIELRQIGVRDKAKQLGGLGPCGREFCCKSFQTSFTPVSVKLAKEQGLSLNPVKISGTCGRLMCCLDHEYATYHELYEITPKVGAIVQFGKKEQGTVIDVNLLEGKLKISPDANRDVPVLLDKSEVVLIKDGVEQVARNEANIDNKFS
ncbi:MAG: stage 0 sporulation protein [Oscillospiraceae bacterium]|jgi:cell fate regulator YaaT (PSP1 superfamily)|nr:stage 0 sporulation protein [Oscillospiraceae bacterium]